jgi:hypothetical protein
VAPGGELAGSGSHGGHRFFDLGASGLSCGLHLGECRGPALGDLGVRRREPVDALGFERCPCRIDDLLRLGTRRGSLRLVLGDVSPCPSCGRLGCREIGDDALVTRIDARTQPWPDGVTEHDGEDDERAEAPDELFHLECDRVQIVLGKLLIGGDEVRDERPR